MTAGLQRPMHLAKGLACGVQPGNETHRHDQVERLGLERRRVHISRVKADAILYAMILGIPACQLKHGVCGIQRVHRISVAGQCDCDKARAASGFENPRPGRKAEIADPAECRVMASW
jgi:hypothetical protein